MITAYFWSLFSTAVILETKAHLNRSHSATGILHFHVIIWSGRSFWSAGNKEEVRSTLTSLAGGPWGRGTWGWSYPGSRTRWQTKEGRMMTGCTSEWKPRTSQCNSNKSHALLGTRRESHLQMRQVRKIHPHAVMQTPPWRLWFP